MTDRLALSTRHNNFLPSSLRITKLSSIASASVRLYRAFLSLNAFSRRDSGTFRSQNRACHL